MRSLPITVLIPCFNDGSTLSAAVDSAFASHVQEVVVVDDGSTDAGTLELFERLAAAGVTVLHIENGGAATARNRGLRDISTAYIFNLDADDELLPGGLESLYEAIMADPSCDVVWGDYCVFGHWDRIQVTGDQIDPWKITVVDDLPVSALFRTESLRQVDGWKADGYEDWDLWMSFAEQRMKGQHVRMPVFRYRTHAKDAERRRDRDVGRHGWLLSEMRSNHQALFKRRARSWLASASPWRVRIVLGLADLLPLSGYKRVWFLWRVNELLYWRSNRRFRAST